MIKRIMNPDGSITAVTFWNDSDDNVMAQKPLNPEECDHCDCFKYSGCCFCE